MATRAAGAAASSPLIGTVGRGVSKPRWASSSSASNSSTTSPGNNPDKKITDRLSGVIDAVNDPPIGESETDITNIVEQRIWHSMEEGQFENLPGKGKPLDLRTNPHADPAEDTLYRILSRNKCLPEWVELNKEIRSNIAEWRSALHRATVYRKGGNNSKWIECSEALKVQLRSINNKVFRYNLIVPFGRQMFGLKWEKELDRLNEKKADC
ncbi:hypothetical protein RHGRI_007121 [Rhododendron griersonianum]|uniref:DnaJ homologue subfamily C member 28 conserved domain-containing protein n=1 Tax=Rhododendron griersonianum TaxID=479676 RepID=A0AAV6KWD7_9ERIC|nr:hypothetical protein RHGRI_007121 [Rhododendron griersonianum]